jgi:penicillin-binding protein 1A
MSLPALQFPRRLLVRALITIGALAFVVSAGGAIWIWIYLDRVESTLPMVESLMNYEPIVPSVVLSKDGEKIGEIFEEKRYPLSLKEMSPTLVSAFVAAEDSRFFEHDGVDLFGLARATLHYFLPTGARQGGSTITQQLAKNLLLTRERTIERKLKDIMVARRIEKVLDKEKILELYLNTIFLGNNSYGVEAAARNYFRKSTKDLSLAEAAMIAGLAPAPSAYSPVENMQKAKVRQRFVLEQMVRDKKVTQEEANAALGASLKVFRAQSPNARAAPYFFSEVRKQVEKLIPAKRLTTEGVTIYTTLDLKLQQVAQNAVTSGLTEYDTRRSYRGAIKHHDNLEKATRATVSRPLSDDEEARGVVVQIFEKIGVIGVATQTGLGLLLEEDHRWVTQSMKESTEENSTPVPFGSVLKVGDEVHLKASGRKTPKRLARALGVFQSMAKYLEFYPKGQAQNQLQYYELTDWDGIEASALVSNAATGDVLAMVGGRGFDTSQFNRVTQAKRQVGSSVKPLYYSYAFDRGFSLASQLDSPPIVIGDWRPENYSKELNGRTTLRRSLINSFNIPSIQLAQALGLSNVGDQFARLGLPWDIREGGFSLVLGSGNATLLEMVQAYTPFANNGRLTPLRYVTRIVDRKGKELYSTEKNGPELLVMPPKGVSREKLQTKSKPLSPSTPAPVVEGAGFPVWTYDESDPLQVLSPQAAFLSVKMMQDVIRFGTGTKAAGASPYAAGKTGTTNNYLDAWFLGVVPGYSVGVWMGFDGSNRTLGNASTGGKMAAPIWRNVVSELVRRYPVSNWREPEGIRWIHIDADSGQVIAGNGGIAIPTIEGVSPGTPRHRNALGVLGLEPDAGGASSAGDEEDTSVLRSTM